MPKDKGCVTPKEGILTFVSQAGPQGVLTFQGNVRQAPPLSCRHQGWQIVIDLELWGLLEKHGLSVSMGRDRQ